MFNNPVILEMKSKRSRLSMSVMTTGEVSLHAFDKLIYRLFFLTATFQTVGLRSHEPSLRLNSPLRWKIDGNALYRVYNIAGKKIEFLMLDDGPLIIDDIENLQQQSTCSLNLVFETLP